MARLRRQELERQHREPYRQPMDEAQLKYHGQVWSYGVPYAVRMPAGTGLFPVNRPGFCGWPPREQDSEYSEDRNVPSTPEGEGQEAEEETGDEGRPPSISAAESVLTELLVDMYVKNSPKVRIPALVLSKHLDDVS